MLSMVAVLVRSVPLGRGLVTAVVNTIVPDTESDRGPMDQKGASGNPPLGVNEAVT